MNLLVYTGVFTKPDILLDPVPLLRNIDKICFTNMKYDGSSKWDFASVNPPITHPGKKQRNIKLYWPKIFERYDYSLYVDSNVQLLVHPRVFVDMLGDNDLLMFRHTMRDCLYDELRRNWWVGKGNCQKLLEQAKKYLQEGCPRHNGLWRGSLLLRKHTEEMIEFSRLWWEEVKEFSYRDQSPFAYLKWKMGLEIAVLEDFLSNPWVQFCDHGKNPNFVRRIK